MDLPTHSGPWPLIQFRNHFLQTVGLFGRVISPSQGRYLHTGQRIHTPNTHALSGIRTHDPGVRASEDSSCLRPRGCDRLCVPKRLKITLKLIITQISEQFPCMLSNNRYSHYIEVAICNQNDLHIGHACN
jgi:hypothetical protein